ncbi:protein MKS1 [Tripterygium wilfordii]|uniref:protein MKS1 n=1 Tax=Tripterygium wilfordii TaxID=458696 RepID=UPI0018F82D80|nr:protein MKS1 [Tripterygium wilfordii]
MDSQFPTSGKPPPPPPPDRRLQIQGPRPSPLKVNKDSHKIKKPTSVPQQQLVERRDPVIIYAVSPKIVETTVASFMTTVQRLTGLSTGDFSGADGSVSPAARLAATEKVSPTEREREKERISEVMAMVDELVEVYKSPGILSPAPATLPPVPTGLFSPASNTYQNPIRNEWSPSALLSGPIISPIHSPDLFNLFFDF